MMASIKDRMLSKYAKDVVTAAMQLNPPLEYSPALELFCTDSESELDFEEEPSTSQCQTSTTTDRVFNGKKSRKRSFSPATRLLHQTCGLETTDDEEDQPTPSISTRRNETCVRDTSDDDDHDDEEAQENSPSDEKWERRIHFTTPGDSKQLESSTDDKEEEEKMKKEAPPPTLKQMYKECGLYFSDSEEEEEFKKREVAVKTTLQKREMSSTEEEEEDVDESPPSKKKRIFNSWANYRYKSPLKNLYKEDQLNFKPNYSKISTILTRVSDTVVLSCTSKGYTITDGYKLFSYTGIDEMWILTLRYNLSLFIVSNPQIYIYTTDRKTTQRYQKSCKKYYEAFQIMALIPHVYQIENFKASKCPDCKDWACHQWKACCALEQIIGKEFKKIVCGKTIISY